MHKPEGIFSLIRLNLVHTNNKFQICIWSRLKLQGRFPQGTLAVYLTAFEDQEQGGRNNHPTVKPWHEIRMTSLETEL